MTQQQHSSYGSQFTLANKVSHFIPPHPIPEQISRTSNSSRDPQQRDRLLTNKSIRNSSSQKVLVKGLKMGNQSHQSRSNIHHDNLYYPKAHAQPSTGMILQQSRRREEQRSIKKYNPSKEIPSLLRSRNGQSRAYEVITGRRDSPLKFHKPTPAFLPMHHYHHVLPPSSSRTPFFSNQLLNIRSNSNNSRFSPKKIVPKSPVPHRIPLRPVFPVYPQQMILDQGVYFGESCRFVPAQMSRMGGQTLNFGRNVMAGNVHNKSMSLGSRAFRNNSLTHKYRYCSPLSRRSNSRDPLSWR